MRFMFKLLLWMLVFGGGFYTGVRFAEHQFVQDPAKLARLLKESVQSGAQEQLEKAKKMLSK